MPTVARPVPPPDLCEPGILFASAPDLKLWAEATLLDPDSSVFNPAHEHLVDPDTGEIEAGIVYCWSSWPGKSRGLPLIGFCELLRWSERQWPKARGLAPVIDWWIDQGGDPEERPDFLITLYAPWWAEASDLEALASLDHEVTHCGIALDEDGEPRYRQSDGQPIWCVRPHDIEEHVSIVERYGAWTPALRRAALALRKGPTIGAVEIQGACGTCSRRIAA